MTTWRYGLPARRPGYPDAAHEIEKLAELQEQGVDAHLMLADRHDPPGKGANPGDELLICLREEDRYVS